MKRAWIYGRDSMRKESLSSQIEKIRQFAEAQQIAVVGTSSEICLGHDIDREGLNEAVQMVRDGQADTLLVCSLDRISDDPSEIKEFAGQIGDLDAVTFVKKDDSVAWTEIKKILQGESPTQSDIGMFFGV